MLLLMSSQTDESLFASECSASGLRSQSTKQLLRFCVLMPKCANDCALKALFCLLSWVQQQQLIEVVIWFKYHKMSCRQSIELEQAGKDTKRHHKVLCQTQRTILWDNDALFLDPDKVQCYNAQDCHSLTILLTWSIQFSWYLRLSNDEGKKRTTWHSGGNIALSHHHVSYRPNDDLQRILS